jgi:DNA-binding XRE family transcriptional regulator
MSVKGVARYCARCGARLAGDHANERCSPCQERLNALLARPPQVPADFWETDQLRAAFAAQHIGQVWKAYRKHPYHIAAYGKDGITQETLGSWLGLTQAQISRIETGPPVRNLDSLCYYARTLRIPSYLLWFKFPSAHQKRNGSPINVGQKGAQSAGALARSTTAVGRDRNAVGAWASSQIIYSSWSAKP